MDTKSKFLLCTILLLAAAGTTIAQEKRESPLSVTASRYKDTYIKIVYSQPQKKGREIFGKLVPYGEVWRTGANETTEITITTDINIGGQALKAGTYSIFTIPNPDSWTIIFNADLGMWGSYNYNPKRDVIRINVSPTSLTEVAEAFTIAITPMNEKADMVFQWDKTKVTIPIQYPEPVH